MSHFGIIKLDMFWSIRFGPEAISWLMPLSG